MRYIALTVGPIVDTLVLGRKTSEIWMASYLFSAFMKNTIREIKALEKAEFIIPYVEDDSLFMTLDSGVGMFHDRFILQTEALTLNEVQEIIMQEKADIASMVAVSIKRDETKVRAFFDQYLQTYLFESDEHFDNPLLGISEILDALELHTPILESEEDYLRLFLNRDVLLNSQLARDAFGKKPTFDSVEAIAAQELSIDADVSNAYRYIAIVHADGDDLGKYIKGQNDSTTVSKKLFDFDKQAVDTIQAYGAMPLFIGGDDLLFFAPVINKEQTIFNLIDTLSTNYTKAMGSTETTLSFGVGITYYKYPLYEALEKSRQALFEQAKSYHGKNAVAISAQKHSGQSFSFCVGKDEDAYHCFSKFTREILYEKHELPHAIHHKLYNHRVLFEQINESRLSATFENLFNEELHKEKFKAGLKSTQDLMNSLGLKSEAQEKLFSMLSTIKLMRGDR